MKTYKTWTKDGLKSEQEMEDEHLESWKDTINQLNNDDFSKGYSILDFGCNQGGFLRLLNKKHPFKNALGIDIASDAIKIANERKGNLPVEYLCAGNLKNINNKFDVAISTSVLFFIEDLQQHANEMYNSLTDKAAYYISFSDFAKSPSLAKIKEEIDKIAETPLVVHTLDDIVKAFSEQGFRVQIKRTQPTYFTHLSPNDSWASNAFERIERSYKHRYLFRMVKNN